VIHLVDDTGRPLSADITQLLLVELALRHLGVTRVALPVTTPAVVAERVRAHRGEVVWTKTEHHAMMASATGVDMVAGARGEFIFSHFLPAYDGMFAAVKLLEALAFADAPLSAIADGYTAIYKRQERVACPWGRKGAVMRRLMEATEDEERQLVDGVKIWRGERAWALVIPHSDKPYFVVTAEGPDEATAESLVDEYARLVERWRDEA
ncbi:MAG: nucleotidyl transferase, partial [Longimicrobiales bacterium]